MKIFHRMGAQFELLISMLEAESRLYHWVDDCRVPTHNNRSEREVRPTVIARKVSFGSQSAQGAKTCSVWMSILHTAKKRLPKKYVPSRMASSGP